MDEKNEKPAPSPPVIDNRTHRAFAFRRTGKKAGRLRWAGLGYIGSEKSPEEIAAIFEGELVDAHLVREILRFATAHLFIEMNPWNGGTGYFRLILKEVKPPRRVQEPDDPREDEGEEDDELLPDS